LRFEFKGCEKEKDHLRQITNDDGNPLTAQAKELRDQGKTFREIGEILEVSLKKAQRLVKESEE